jgi:ubiquinone/menaquinone biosynthesis C-methylase UbiE
MNEPEASDPVRRAYDRLARVYDRRWRFYIDASSRATLARLPEALGNELLDVGCGTGALLAALGPGGAAAPRVGLDLSPAMLGQARRKCDAGTLLVAGRGEALPFPDARFDCVVSVSSFHYFRAPRAASREIVRVLRPGGVVRITDWCDDFLSCRLCDWVLRWVDPAHVCIHGSADCRAFLEEAGLARVEVERYRISWLWGLMTARAEKPKAPRGPEAPGSP